MQCHETPNTEKPQMAHEIQTLPKKCAKKKAQGTTMNHTMIHRPENAGRPNMHKHNS
jgi:hypothetical protein